MKNKQISLIFFLIIQLFIFTMIVSYNELINVRFLSITSTFLCFLLGLFLFCKTKDYFVMIIALFFTLISDVILLFFDSLSSVGLFLLNIVQLLYLTRTLLDSDYKKHNLVSRLVLFPIILIGYIVLKDRIDINAILWIIYIVNIFLNIMFTIKDIGLNNFFPIGLIFLFIHASLMMFLSLENYTIVNVPFINFLQTIPFDVKMVFYLPAQVILTCSIFTVNRRSFSKFKKEDN